jgi:putative acetyltransferase
MMPSIGEFGEFPLADLYKLISDVYTTSDGMSERFEDKYPTLESFERAISESSSRPGAIALVASIGEQPLGYIMISPRQEAKLRHTADLNMGVHHKARGRGIGKLLLREALRRAQQSPDLEILYLMVRADNAPAIRLYQEHGFDTLAVLDYDTKIGDSYYDGLLMRKFAGNFAIERAHRTGHRNLGR